MSRARSFDWDEAARLRAAGATYRELAERYGKTYHGIRYGLDAEFRERLQQAHDRWQRSGTCPDCGTQTTRRSADSAGQRCLTCSGASRQAVRGDEAWCHACKSWLPKTEFYADNTTARGIKNDCKGCNNRRRAANREANRDRERAYDRERKRRLRGSS